MTIYDEVRVQELRQQLAVVVDELARMTGEDTQYTALLGVLSDVLEEQAANLGGVEANLGSSWAWNDADRALALLAGG